MKNNKKNSDGLNGIIIVILSMLYILLITKFAEIVSTNINGDDDTQIGTYVMVIYFISIIGIIGGYLWLDEQQINGDETTISTPQWIVRWSLNIGGVCLLLYTITNYWEYLGDYAKLALIVLSIMNIIYYLFKYY